MTKKTRKKNLEQKGWNLVSVLSEPRLSEVVQLYKEIGFEVQTFPFDLTEDSDQNESDNSTCFECFKAKNNLFAVYTRKKRTSNA